eukprot:10252340-Prorocentrum_lima.AAC.1
MAHRRCRSTVEPDLRLGAVEAETRTRPGRRHCVKGQLHLGEREDEVEVVDVGNDGDLNTLPSSRLSTGAGYTRTGG